MYSLAKWLDTEYFPETKKAFFKERKNGEIAVCYRGRCWSYLFSWCILGREDKYDLSKIFKKDKSTDRIFLQNAKKFIRSPDSEQYLDDALEVFNRFSTLHVFSKFENPSDFSDILQLSAYFINEPLPISCDNEIQRNYYNAMLKLGKCTEKSSFVNFITDWDLYKHLNITSNIKPKELIAYTSHIRELSSDWKEASKHLRPTFSMDLNEKLESINSVGSEAIYRIAKSICYFEKAKPSNHFSRIYIDSIFNVERDITKIFKPTNIIDNFTLLQGEEPSSLIEISNRISACSKALFMEPFPEHLLTLFSDKDSFSEKVNFLGSFFVKTQSFLGCIHQNLDVLRELRTEGDRLGELMLNVHCLSPRTHPDYEILLINFIRENCAQLTLLEKFEILKLFTSYHSTFKHPNTLKLFLTFFGNHLNATAELKEIKSSIIFLAECLKNTKMSNNLLRNLNTENTSFRTFLEHFTFSKNPLILPLFAASTLPSDLDWNQIIKMLTSGTPSGTKFGSSKSIKNYSENRELFSLNKSFSQHNLDSNLNDLFLNVFIANTAKSISNIKELSALLVYIRLFQKFYNRELIGAQIFDQSPILKIFVKNIQVFHDVEPIRIPLSLKQVQALLDPFETQNLTDGDSKSISNLLARLVKIPDTYQPLTNKLIEKAGSFYFSKEDSLRVNGLKNLYCELKLEKDIPFKQSWNDSKIITLLKTMHFGTILGQRLNEDVVIHILEFFLALTLDVDTRKLKLDREALNSILLEARNWIGEDAQNLR